MSEQCANGGCMASSAPVGGYFHKPKYCTAALASGRDLAKLYAIIQTAYFVCICASIHARLTESVDLAPRGAGPKPAIRGSSRHEHRRIPAPAAVRRGGAQRLAASRDRRSSGRQGGGRQCRSG